ncbi:preprotein translocase subunit YajC [Rubritalea spongiae]|uniref:Sec translocon accessory complex subunit YajC n=1 Tax=Rubritalea spongiae TaxID=430797 RepID=A0ABW5E1K0_9BACT
MTNTLNIFAQGGGAGGPGQFIFIGIMIVIMWVIMIRPQQKRQKELKAKQEALKVGDKVVTIGGMHATVNALSEKTVSLRLAENVFVKYDRTAIATVISKDSKGEKK